MKVNSTKLLISFCLSILIMSSCTQPAANYGGVGGGLPTHYISILDGAIRPSNLTVSVGSSITFINQSTSNQTIVSDNFSMLTSPTLPPNGYYYFNKTNQDTIINFRSVENPNLTGTITLRP